MPTAPAPFLDSDVRTILVLGGGGFIGRHLASALTVAGWRVLRAVRPPADRSASEVSCDLAQMESPEDWLPLLDGVDAVVNAAGILRETHSQGFDQIHHHAPVSLARACVARGIRRFVQISALGDPADGEFIGSKHRFDRALLECIPQALVLRPSVVYSTAGSFGGTSLLRALAATPGLLPLPGHGEWLLQPVAAEDLSALVVAGLERNCHGIYEVGGPQPVSLREYQLRWRSWLRIPGRRCLRLPLKLVDMQVALGECLGGGPMGMTMWRMLKRGNVTRQDAHARLRGNFGCAPRSLDAVLGAVPSQVQDRWQARLYPLAFLLKFATIGLWLLSAAAGFLTPSTEIGNVAAGSWLAGAEPVLLARSTAGLDFVLAA